MSHEIARQSQHAFLVAAMVGLFLLAGCDTLLSSQTPLPPPTFKPIVTLNSPASGTSVSLNDPVTIDATATDASGILRVDFLVNAAVIDSQRLFVASRRFEYQTTWRPTTAGQNTLTIIAYNVNNVASDQVSVAVSVSGLAATATLAPGTATMTPFVIFVTATPVTPTRALITPVVTVITATPPATSTRTPTAIQVNTVVATATTFRTITPTTPITATKTQPPN
jgi:hypothetical protein